MSYDVFISYSRRDIPLCDGVATILKELGYRVFVDRTEILGGTLWEQEIGGAIDSDLRPTVVLLATQNAVARPENIRKELDLARAKSLPILPLEFDRDAALAFIDDDVQFVPTSRDLGPEVRRSLHRALHRGALEHLKEGRSLAHRWVESATARHGVDFWNGLWRDLLQVEDDGARSFAAIGPGGRGKTTLLAHYVDEMLSAPQAHPILVPVEDLAASVGRLTRRLGAVDEAHLPDRVRDLEETHGIRIAFIVDGLERAAAADVAGGQSAAAALHRITSAGTTVVTCRDVVWNAVFGRTSGLAVIPIGELNDALVADVLTKAGRAAPRSSALLRLPLLLDAYLRLSPGGADAEVPPDPSETALVRSMLDLGFSTGRPALPDVADGRDVARALTECQLDALDFAVPMTKITDALAGRGDVRAVVSDLERRGALTTIRTAGERRVRRSHDVLDAFAVAFRARSGARVDDVLNRFAEGAAWMVVSALVQIAHDDGDEALSRRIFDRILWTLDRKKVVRNGEDPNNTVAMAAAWAATYVLTERFDVLEPSVVKCLDGVVERSIAVGDPRDLDRRASRIEPEPAVTQETLSTLASAFRARPRVERPDSESAIRVLERILHNDLVRYKGRAIEALARFTEPAAVAALCRFAEAIVAGDTDAASRDPEALEYVAAALIECRADARAVGTLGRIAVAAGATYRARWLAARELGIEIGEPSAEELRRWLELKDRFGNYSDWSRVAEAADIAGAMARSGALAPSVVAALVRALGHPHVFVRRPVARALGFARDPDAGTALVREFTKTQLPRDVEVVCLEALETYFLRAVARERQAVTLLAHRAAGELDARGTGPRAQSLRALFTRTGDDVGAFADADAVEIPRDDESALFETTLVADAASVAVAPALAEAALKGAAAVSFGPQFEEKLRVVGVSREPAGGEVVSLAPCTWAEGRRFHWAARQYRPELSVERLGRSLVPAPLGDSQVPGIACAHVLVVTSDDRLLTALRSKSSTYCPDTWSVSFEEQLIAADVARGGDAFAAAARRGFDEEFGLDAAHAQARTRRLVVETAILNVAGIVEMKVPYTADEIVARWAREPRPRHHHEADDVRSIASDADVLRTIVAEGFVHGRPMHPTSRIRLVEFGRRR